MMLPLYSDGLSTYNSVVWTEHCENISGDRLLSSCWCKFEFFWLFIWLWVV